VVGASWEFLFFPIATEARHALRRFVGAVVQRVAEGAAGLLLLVTGLSRHSDVRGISLALAALALLWIVVELRLSGEYVHELGVSVRRLTRRKARPGPAPPGAARDVAELIARNEAAQRAVHPLVPDDPGRLDELLPRAAPLERSVRRLLQEGELAAVESLSDVRRLAFAIPEAKARELFEQVVAKRADEAFDRLLDWMTTAPAGSEIRLAARGLLDDDPRARGQATEYLQNLLPAGARHALFKAAEEIVRARSDRPTNQSLAERSRRCVHALGQWAAREGDPWLRACAVFAIGQLRLETHRAAVEGCLESPEALVRDAARWALARLDATDSAATADDIYARLCRAGDAPN
jgi:hypothetical protein